MLGLAPFAALRVTMLSLAVFLAPPRPRPARLRPLVHRHRRAREGRPGRFGHAALPAHHQRARPAHRHGPAPGGGAPGRRADPLRREAAPRRRPGVHRHRRRRLLPAGQARAPRVRDPVGPGRDRPPRRRHPRPGGDRGRVGAPGGQPAAARHPGARRRPGASARSGRCSARRRRRRSSGSRPGAGRSGPRRSPSRWLLLRLPRRLPIHTPRRSSGSTRSRPSAGPRAAMSPGTTRPWPTRSATIWRRRTGSPPASAPPPSCSGRCHRVSPRAGFAGESRRCWVMPTW